MDKQLGRLEKVDLRNVWANEALNFTPWLARDENLQLLANTIGIELEHEATEKNVGPFFADILCKDVATDSWVVIENQLETTDHKHLGQLFTYGAGLKASTVIWIASKFTDEHRAALDWLNEISDDHIAFLGIEIELWKIGDSLTAPKFNIVCKPNEWTREVEIQSSEHITDAKLIQLQFWQSFSKYLIEHQSKIKPNKPSARSYMNFSIGRSGFSLSASASYFNSLSNSYDSDELRVDIVLRSQNAKQHLAKLMEQKEAIETELGLSLVWYSSETGRMCRIYTQTDAEIQDKTLWNKQHQWLMENLEKMDSVFRKRIKNL